MDGGRQQRAQRRQKPLIMADTIEQSVDAPSKDSLALKRHARLCPPLFDDDRAAEDGDVVDISDDDDDDGIIACFSSDRPSPKRHTLLLQSLPPSFFVTKTAVTRSIRRNKQTSESNK